MPKTKRANEQSAAPAATAADGPVVIGDLLGTSRERGAATGTRIESVTPAVAAASPTPAAPSAAPAPASGSGPARRVLGALAFAAIAAAGVYVGVRSDSVGDALQTVSVVLVATAVLIYLAAFVLWIRSRGRSVMSGTGAAATDAAAADVDVAAGSPGLEPHVPTLADVAAQLDASSRPAPPAAMPVPAPPAVPVVATVPAPPSVPAPSVPVVASAPGSPSVPAVGSVPPPPAPVPPPPSAVAPLPVVRHDESVMDAIAPYTEVVGRPVIRTALASDVPAPTAPVAPTPSAIVPPPPPTRAPVPPPPPPAPARAAVPPPPPAPATPTVQPSPPPPATTAAEVFAAMAAAGEPARNGTGGTIESPGPLPIETVAPTLAPGTVTKPDPAEAIDLFADLPADAPAAAADGAAIVSAAASGEAVTPAAPELPASSPVAKPPSRVEVTDRVSERRVGASLPARPERPWVPPLPAVADGSGLAHLAGAEVAARSAVGSVAPVVVYRYRKWVLGQMTPGNAFGPVDVDRSPDEWLLLATCGVATLLAWTHEDHHFTYPVHTWVDEILPAHGVRIRDTDLAHDLIMAAALHAGGVDSVPTERLRSYAPGDLVTAMASIHVGLLRLYCGLGRIEPERVLADQYGIGPGDIPLH